ncbi:uncharacterized protein LOC130429865 [Triplophysa dalaica]|uniref:uncharacterized protein LOC130429865 n=1 Tax=Triplophysa dalaica TaxID=1582913 RepID=UPI0024E0015E|nr:uncharacterized protein LOC130429865 [Triplophysa dalaica]
MFYLIVFFWGSWSLEGVFGSEFVSVSVMEGDSVLLSVNITEAQRRDGIMWTYGPTIPLAKLNAENKITYNGKSLLSRISVFDFNIRLSLPLEVEYQDNNTYRCVINNPITNHTQHLHITQLCHTRSGFIRIVVICCAVVGSVMIVAALLIFCICRKHTHTQQQDQSGEDEITYAETTFYKGQIHKPVRSFMTVSLYLYFSGLSHLNSL